MPGPRELLEADRRQVMRRLTVLRRQYAGMVEAARESNADDEHDPEGATIAYERSQLEALVKQSEASLTDIEDAIRRLDAGTYGRCETCGEPIAAGRLEARPLARTCIRCAASP